MAHAVPEPMPTFPAGFRWGVSTAAHQIEGALSEDGRGPSIWDTFGHTPGVVAGGDTADVACDHYHRYAEDVALMRELGIDLYRFSVSWTRIQADGTGKANPAGLDFYRRLVDELLTAGITPALTLYHWDLPQALEDQGGWRNRDTAHRFADYATIVHDALGDRVPLWTTLNEPYGIAFVSHADGGQAPGAREGHGALAVAHHLLVAHGLAMQGLRAQRKPDNEFGLAFALCHISPATDSPADIAAARRLELLYNRSFTDPILAGRYPDGEDELWRGVSDFAFRRDGDLDLAATPMDFVGVNTYFPQYAKAALTRHPDPARRVATDIGVLDCPPAHLPRTAMGWPVEPAALTRLLRWLHDNYPGMPPMLVTENGAAYPDDVVDGRVHDPHRIAYLDGHIRAVHDAIAVGVDVRGYSCWSLLDNFEWAHGYGKRFGLVYVDFATQKRIPKASFDWYRDLVRATPRP